MTSFVLSKLFPPGGSRCEACEASEQLLDFLKYVFRYFIATRDSEFRWNDVTAAFSAWIEEPRIHEKWAFWMIKSVVISVKRICHGVIIRVCECVSVWTNPELDQVERVLGTFAEQLLQAAFLLGELVVDLPDVHALQQGVAVAQAALADVHEQVLVVLQETPGEQAGVQVSLTPTPTLTSTPAGHEGAELARKHRYRPTTGSGLYVCVLVEV